MRRLSVVLVIVAGAAASIVDTMAADLSTTNRDPRAFCSVVENGARLKVTIVRQAAKSRVCRWHCAGEREDGKGWNRFYRAWYTVPAGSRRNYLSQQLPKMKKAVISIDCQPES